MANDFARAARKVPTDAERRLWWRLRARQLGVKFRRQVPLGPYVVDFVCFEARLVVECDGGQHAESALDATRDAWFEREGYRVLRFWNHEVLRETDAVIERIWKVVQERRR
ncbi:MAG: endonuclease domain-containing protein [Alphaproteobacteria bacterium]|nr:endonuclease domain-containing protein [Alphaproteobacteria bacterium]